MIPGAQILLLIFIFAFNTSFAQTPGFARKTVDTLSSSYFWGRGYTNNGLAKAADFLSQQFGAYGLTPLSEDSFLQRFSFNVNTFPGNMKVSVNGERLRPGVDFIVGPESRGIDENCKLVQIDSVNFQNDKNRIVVKLVDKLTWSVSVWEENYTSIVIARKALTRPPTEIKIDIENKYLKGFSSANVCGLVKGTSKPDSLFVITAHYDHLGGMGKETFFPGANDNASGVALMLQLAKYYAQNPQEYSIAFIAFAGEEAGLLGSKHFTENPLFDMKKVKFLINSDLAGTGEEGITVVNGGIFKTEFNLLTKINEQEKYLVKINSRGKAANSDHYWFTEKGVRAFFIYTMGGIKAYHDVNDKAETLPLTEHEDLFRLILKFNKALMD